MESTLNGHLGRWSVYGVKISNNGIVGNPNKVIDIGMIDLWRWSVRETLLNIGENIVTPL